jgi:hypothetical protein
MRVPHHFLGMALDLEWTNDWGMEIKSHGRSPALSALLLPSATSDVLRKVFYTHSENPLNARPSFTPPILTHVSRSCHLFPSFPFAAVSPRVFNATPFLGPPKAVFPVQSISSIRAHSAS